MRYLTSLVVCLVWVTILSAYDKPLRVTNRCGRQLNVTNKMPVVQRPTQPAISAVTYVEPPVITTGNCVDGKCSALPQRSKKLFR